MISVINCQSFPLVVLSWVIGVEIPIEEITTKDKELIFYCLESAIAKYFEVIS